MASYKVGILGATGAVGEQMRIVLAERSLKNRRKAVNLAGNGLA